MKHGDQLSIALSRAAAILAPGGRRRKAPCRNSEIPDSFFDRRIAAFARYKPAITAASVPAAASRRAHDNRHYRRQLRTMDRSLVETSGQIIGGSIDNAALPAPAPDLAKLGSQAADFARNSRAKATAAAYRSDWRHFEGWCARSGLESLPATPATVGAYLADNASHLKFATLARRVAAIAAAH